VVGSCVDPTTGLTYNQARWYDPTTGQFLSVDPKIESTWQPYAYANDNPISNTDPSGMDNTHTTVQQDLQMARANQRCEQHPNDSGCRTGALGRALDSAVKAVVKNPGAALEVTAIVAVQFVPGVDAAVDTIGAGWAAAGTFGAAQGLNYVTGHFTVGGAIVDATFTFPAAFPELADSDEAKAILQKFATAVGGTGVGVGVLVQTQK